MLPQEWQPELPWPDATEGTRIYAALRAWAQTCPKPLVLFFDEIDALVDRTLESVLRQLRDGFSYRPKAFPHSIILCGLRDIRDYKIASGGSPRLGTASPFNVKVESLKLGMFSKKDVHELYQQHCKATGQSFTAEALDKAFELKVWAEGKPDPLAQGLEQLDRYLSSLTLSQGTLVIFDRRTSPVAKTVCERTEISQILTL